MQDERKREKWNIPDEQESISLVASWRPLPSDEEHRKLIKKWVHAKEGAPPFKWPLTPSQEELRSAIKSMKGGQFERQLDMMVEQKPVLHETAQFKALLKKTRTSSKKGKETSAAFLTPEECIRNIIHFIYCAGPNGICARYIERRFYISGNSRTEGMSPLIRSKSTLHRWLAHLVTIGYLEKEEAVIPSRRSPNKEKANVYYRATELVRFAPHGGIFWSLKGQRLEEQIAHMPDYATDPGLVKAHGIEVPELAVLACRRLKIAKDILLVKAGVLDPNETIDEMYKRYYDMESPNPPNVL